MKVIVRFSGGTGNYTYLCKASDNLMPGDFVAVPARREISIAKVISTIDNDNTSEAYQLKHIIQRIDLTEYLKRTAEDVAEN